MMGTRMRNRKWTPVVSEDSTRYCIRPQHGYPGPSVNDKPRMPFRGACLSGGYPSPGPLIRLRVMCFILHMPAQLVLAASTSGFGGRNPSPKGLRRQMPGRDVGRPGLVEIHPHSVLWSVSAPSPTRIPSYLSEADEFNTGVCSSAIEYLSREVCSSNLTHCRIKNV